MSKTYVLITSQIGKDDSIIAMLRPIETVQEAHGTFGSYDIIVKLESDKEEKILDDISKKIRKIQEIRSTLTLIVKGNGGFKKTSKEETQILEEHMAQAFAMIHCNKSELIDIMNELEKIPEVIECDSLLGTFELICKITAPTYNEISEIVGREIRKIKNIKSTSTLNVVQNQGFNKKLEQTKNLML